MLGGLFLFVGCSSDSNQVKDAVPNSLAARTSVPTAIPTDAAVPQNPPLVAVDIKIPSAPILDAIPIWPQPGRHLAAAGPDPIPYQAYRPISFKGQTLVPIQTPVHFLIIKREQDKIYLLGRYRRHPGVSLLEQPQLLFELPHYVGQEWTIGFEPGGSDSAIYRVLSIAEGETPVGRLPLVVVEVTGTRWGRRLETWAPGYGLVTLAVGDRVSYRAERIVVGDAKQFPAVGHLKPNQATMLLEGKNGVALVDMDGEEVGRISNQTVRDTIAWRQVGREEFLWQESPVSDIASAWRAFVLDQNRLHLVKWVSPDWDNTYIPVAASPRDGAGLNVRFDPDGTITYVGTGIWAGKTYRFRWDSDTLTFKGELRK